MDHPQWVKTRDLRAGLGMFLTVLSLHSLCSRVLADEAEFCKDLTYLVAQSQTGFSEILGDTGGPFGGFHTTYPLPGADFCVVLDDVTKRAYQCSWSFAYQDAAAEKTFHHYLTEMQTCLGEQAEEREGQPVNHPDSYHSTYFILPDGQVSVTLKNKSGLAKTFVSVGVDSSTP